MPPAAAHLGIPLKAETFPGHHVGCRYWAISGETLGGPCVAGGWAPGLNRGACAQGVHRNHKAWMGCSCGLYCFAYDKTVQKTVYFDMPTATPNAGPDAGVVGGIAYWIPRIESPIPGQTIVSAKYAAVAALTFPKGASKSHREVIERLAARYEVEIVKPKHLGEAVDEWVASRLPDFYDPPARPIRELEGTQPEYCQSDDWQFVPRTPTRVVYDLAA